MELDLVLCWHVASWLVLVHVLCNLVVENRVASESTLWARRRRSRPGLPPFQVLILHTFILHTSYYILHTRTVLVLVNIIMFQLSGGESNLSQKSQHIIIITVIVIFLLAVVVSVAIFELAVTEPKFIKLIFVRVAHKPI